MFDSPSTSKPASTPLHKLSWVGLFLTAGALASWVVFGRNGESEPRGEAHAVAAVAAPPAAASAGVAAAPAVERRSLKADASKSAPIAEATAVADEPADEATGDGKDDGVAAKPSLASAMRTRSSSTLAAETRAALMRGPSQKVARVSANPPPRRKRPTRADAPEAAAGDTELDGMFAQPSPVERPRAAEGDLEGMFPRDEAVSLGANGAPVPD